MHYASEHVRLVDPPFRSPQRILNWLWDSRVREDKKQRRLTTEF